MTVLALDVDDDASVADVFGKVGSSLDVLVNNAGIYSIDAVEDESGDDPPRHRVRRSAAAVPGRSRRAALSGLLRDEDYYERVLAQTGVDLRSMVR